MAFIFNMRSAPVGSMRNQDPNSSVSAPLPPIDEDAPDGASFTAPRVPPPVPPRAWNRPAHKVFGLGAPPRLNHETSPPEYSQFDSIGVEGPNGEKLADVRKGLRDNKHIAKRGGWRKLALITLLVCLCIVGLVVGLVVGLRNRHNTSSNIPGSNSSGGASGSLGGGPTNPASNTTFPAGSYSIETYLDTVSTNCTSNSATWLCYPYVTYASSTSQSAAEFDWIISPVEGSNNYTVSSTMNYFSVVFENASMALMDAGTDQEHYFFQFNMSKPVKPSSPLTSSNVASTCFFNQTIFQAYLYTKMEKTYPANSTSTNTTAPFTPWPYAVKVEQVSSSGSGIPTCVDLSGNSLGDFSVPDTAAQCECLYQNTGT